MRVTDDMIDPQLRKRGAAFKKMFDVKSEKTFIRAQAAVSKVRYVMKTKKLQCKEAHIKNPDNERLRVCVYTSHNPKKNAVGLLWLHGGGYAIGAPEQDLTFIQNFIEAANCVVISPDYRLSVTDAYPAAVNDCYQTLLWMKRHAKKLGIREDQLFVGGDSAGGGLAAALTLRARDKGEVNLAFSMPFYPMLDDRMLTPSSKENDAPVWNSKANIIAWKMYLGELSGNEDVPVYAAPGRETNYKNLPPAYSFVGDLEPFYDETKQYFANLKEAGVTAELDIYKGCYHAFDTICPNSDAAKKAASRYIQKFQYAAEHYYKNQP